MHREEEINIKDYLFVLLRRKNSILLVLLVCLPFILIKAFSATPVYQSTTKLLIQKNYDPSFLSNYRFSYDPYFLSTQTQLIKSSKVAATVVESLSLDETYSRYFQKNAQDSSIARDLVNWFKNLYSVGLKLAGINTNDPSASPIVKSESNTEETKKQKIESLAKMVRNGIAVDSNLEKGEIVNVSFSSTNPVFAADVVNTVVSAYKRLLLEMKLESTTQTLEWLKINSDAERIKLEASEKKLREYKQEHDIYTVNDQEAIFPKKIAQISDNLTHAQAEVNELESLYIEINRITPEEAINLPVVADNETVSELRRQFINKEQEIAGLSKSIGYKHPKMIRAKKNLNAMKEKLSDEIRNVIQSIKNRYELADQKAKSLEVLLNKTKQNAAFMGDKFIQYEILNRDVEVHRLLYDRLLSRIKEFNITEQQQTIDVWVIESADTPTSPITKGPKRAVLVGILFSLAAGIGLAFFLDHMDNTVKTSEDAENRLGLPILGMIPLLKESEQDIEKIVLQSPSSITSEAYKAIRTSVLLSSPDSAPKSILISSMNQGVGKTVTSVNLAISFAQSNKKVLLIDGDMRRARVHKIFNLENTSGLSTYLSGQSDITILKNNDLDYLDIAPAGPVPPNPSELLSSSRLNKLIMDLSDNYDFIIFDSPPMFNVSDAHLISKAAAQTILVTRSGLTTYDAVTKAYKMLTDINSEMLGLVINAVDLKKQQQYYSKYDGPYGYYKNDYIS